MLLRYSSHSPYVRKVLLVAHELGIASSIKLAPTRLRVADHGFWAENPLGKIPVLTLDNGVSYSDSRVICEYLDAAFGDGSLLPAGGNERWLALTRVALADGIVDAGMLARQEALRPEHLRDPALPEFQLGKVARGLDRLEGLAASGELSARFDMAGIAAASALGWLTMRFGAERILEPRNALSAWYGRICERPSMRATDAAYLDEAAGAAAARSHA